MSGTSRSAQRKSNNIPTILNRRPPTTANDGEHAQDVSQPDQAATAYPRRSSRAEDLLSQADDREATELPALEHASTGHDNPSSRSTYSASHHSHQPPTWCESISRWWTRHIALKAPIEKRRDHLALERTFLGYLRTSLALSMMGVAIVQLFRLKTPPPVDGQLGYFELGIPLGAAFICAAIVVCLLGAVRFLRQQGAMLRGKVWAGGWEMLGIMALLAVLMLVTFAVLLAVGKGAVGE